MILFRRTKPYTRVILARCEPLEWLDVKTGEKGGNLAEMLTPGGLVVFVDLPAAIEALGPIIGGVGAFEIYGDTQSAAYLHLGRSGVKFSGLGGYGFEGLSLRAGAEFWRVLAAMCEAAGTGPGASPGATAMNLVGALAGQMIEAPSRPVQAFCRQAYSAGARHARPGIYPRAFLYDMRSAFPAAMSEPLPFGMWTNGKRAGDFYIARLSISYKSRIEFSPLWLRAEDGVFHPRTARRVTVVLNSIDLATLQQHGDLQIHREYDRVSFECLPALAPVQEFLSEWQTEYPQYRQAIKVLRNAIYGKLAAGGGQTRYILKRITSPDDSAEQYRKAVKAAVATEKLYQEINGYEFGLFRYESAPGGFAHLPAASAITALVRARLYDQCDRNSVCTRTDAILSACERHDLPLGGSSGQWSQQDRGRAIVFGSPGFVINGTSHLDGVQDYSARGHIAVTRQRARWSFDGATHEQRWALSMGKKEVVKAEGHTLYVDGAARDINVAKGF